MFQTFDISNYEFLSNNLSLKYQRFTSSDFKDIEIRKFLCVAKTQLHKFQLLKKLSFRSTVLKSKPNGWECTAKY